MSNKHFLALLFITFIGHSLVCAQELLLYKQIDTTKLFMKIYKPPNFNAIHKYPAMVFYFGGGWNGGSINQFEPHAKYFSTRGIICILADYRVKKRHHTTPFESLKYAKSAIRYLRENAQQLGIDTSKIIAAGGSAGGHLAAATALIEDYNEQTDNLAVSCIPNALVLFNPVIDNGPGGYGFERIGEHYKNFSPLHNIKSGAPPTIIFLGTKDRLIPVATVKYYQKVMEKVNSPCQLYLYKNQGHGFFNYNKFKYYKKTVSETDEFLQAQGFLKRINKIKIEKS